MLMWAYPREFKSATAAAQVTDSPYRFLRLRWGTHLYFLALGYAILDGPTMPIIGEGDKEPNDTYVEQLVSSAKAAIDEVVRRGVADRNRIAIGGHSYGAFMTANLLAHSDLYRAGIARSGAYNRTLTPFGFQAEERTFWQAPEVYFKMSPFMHAHKINEPILLIHGMVDNNTGTFPVQSERFYHALKGHGATTRLAMLPHESHGYRARESVLQMYWEMNEWLEKYLKNAPPRKTSNE
jgi:dipeptidyl aminopeptidase/acylaminoacyl peptidase